MFYVFIKYKQATLSNFLIDGNTKPVDLVLELSKHFHLSSPENYCLLDLAGKRIDSDSSTLKLDDIGIKDGIFSKYRYII